ncbi:MAG: tRNA (adenosine(37)-N6)-dimethylallyltransferase MiaA [Terriglobales bacterium]
MERALNSLELAESRKLERESLLVVVLGPTASGKTALALAVARRFHGEIVNCDSVAMYREFEIGTAKPTAAERAEIPHHLLDCVNPLADINAGEYARLARQVLREIAQRDRIPGESPSTNPERRRSLPIVSGGTGLYLRALLQGLFAGPQRSEELRNRLRTRVEKRGKEHLHRILRRFDPAAAERIHANDVAKVIRAIEVCVASRQSTWPTMTELWQQGREPLRGFRILRLGLNPQRESLYARINQRASKMFDEGLMAETEGLLRKYGEEARPLSSLGYKQAVQFLRGQIARESAQEAAQQAHRNYAKRQMTWFRREPDVHWLSGFGDDPAIQAESIAIVQKLI